MRRGEMRVENRRTKAEAEDGHWCDVLYQMGMPLLYIGAFAAGIIGITSMGIISRYWSDLSPPMCFLYSKTASNLIVYRFGTNVGTCTWVTYGGVAALVLAFITGIVFWIKARGDDEPSVSIHMVVAGIIISTLLMLAVSCTLAEGMRLTCAAMDLNSANNKGSDCFEKLNTRVSQYNLPVSSSTMVRASMCAMWTSTILFFIITCFHSLDLYSRSINN
ncbi:hypothetical protein OTU49_009073 [Cherax quadricarinatus]|uniref:Uncharacterized protein n=1 Tax=Cherax quadricarinatus TaxID=27406 RepID=A0AAW0WM16_CHEQU|nr:uncharacterized protein LOC128700365 [Cherax quadricarinatus]